MGQVQAFHSALAGVCICLCVREGMAQVSLWSLAGVKQLLVNIFHLVRSSIPGHVARKNRLFFFFFLKSFKNLYLLAFPFFQLLQYPVQDKMRQKENPRNSSQCSYSSLKVPIWPFFPSSLRFFLMFVLYITSRAFSCTYWEGQEKVHRLYLWDMEVPHNSPFNNRQET